MVKVKNWIFLVSIALALPCFDHVPPIQNKMLGWQDDVDSN